MTGSETFEPQIVAFCCLNCAYTAADLAGSSRSAYPAAIKVVALPCTGRVDVLHVLRALEDGADGVLVAGCLTGRCHYLTGNLHAKQRVDYLRGLLDEIGLESERVRMINVSAGMGAQFAQLVTETAERIQELGPNPLRRRKSTPAADEAAKAPALEGAER